MKKSFVFLILSIVFVLASMLVIEANKKKLFYDRVKSGKTIVIKIEGSEIVIGRTQKAQHKNESHGQSEIKKVEHLNKQDESSNVVQKTQKPKISLIVGELGLSKSTTLDALKMNKDVTLGFSPYSNDLMQWIEQAHEAKHEVILNIPMQPVDYPMVDPGPLALLQNLSNTENMQRLDKIVTSSNNFAAVYSGENEVFTNSKTNMVNFFDYLKNKKLGFIYGGKSNFASLDFLSGAAGVKISNIDVVLDEDVSDLAMQGNLLKLQSIAKVNGYAIGKFRPYPVSISFINKWISQNTDFEIIPISHGLALSKQHNVDADNKGSSEELVKLKNPVVSDKEFENYYNNPKNMRFSRENMPDEIYQEPGVDPKDAHKDEDKKEEGTNHAQEH